MSLQLLSNLGKQGVDYGLLSISPDIEDTSHLSSYFDIIEFNSILTAGKNSFSFNGTPLLLNNSEIKIQCIDSNGNSLYLEYPQSNVQFTDVAKYIISIHVYNNIYNGAGKLILLGITTKNEIVRWIGNISIDKTLSNTSKTRFFNTPTIEARSLLYPVVDNSIVSALTKNIDFSGRFYSIAVNPSKDTIKSTINPKLIDIDYRLVLNSANPSDLGPQLYPTKSMNSQMEEQDIDLITNIINPPYSYQQKNTSLSASFNVKKVIDSKTIELSNAFFYNYGKDHIITNIVDGEFTSSYKWVAYNPSIDQDSYKKYVSDSTTTYIKNSYAEITYRNIKSFTGYVARHKLYRKSLLYAGNFELILDEPLSNKELLEDPITSNKSYNLMGTFYNIDHIQKYWHTSSNMFQLSHSVTPRIDSMKIGKLLSFDDIVGNDYIILKTNSIINIDNDPIYYAYDAAEYNDLQGKSYNCNFLNLKSGSLYALSMNLSIDKDQYSTDSKLQFFLTSSISSIIKEENYVEPFGLKLGEISTTENVPYKLFSDKKYLFFIPKNDYYGTLIIVPYKCTMTLSSLSLIAYSDYGFSPDVFVTTFPFKINSANEAWKIKSELYDINSNLIYSNLNTIQNFDLSGESLFNFIGNTSLVNIESVPTNDSGVVTTKDYILLKENNADSRAMIVSYDGSATSTRGYRIFIDESGTKHVYN